MHRQYRHGGADYEIELQSRFYDDLAVWFNINIFRRDSKELGFCDPLSLHVYPVSGGFIIRSRRCAHIPTLVSVRAIHLLQ